MSNPIDPTDPAAYSGYADPAAAPTPPVDSAYQQPTQPGYPAAYPATSSPILTTIGDMHITQFEVITPNGTHPLNGTSWYVTDNSTFEQATPQWAIVCAIVGFFFVCVLSLLFLLVKEQKATGSVVLTVQGNGWSHVTQLPPGTGANAHAQAAYVRTLVAALPAS
jgi:hypothetical protein